MTLRIGRTLQYLSFEPGLRRPPAQIQTHAMKRPVQQAFGATRESHEGDATTRTAGRRESRTSLRARECRSVFAAGEAGAVGAAPFLFEVHYLPCLGGGIAFEQNLGGRSLGLIPGLAAEDN